MCKQLKVMRPTPIYAWHNVTNVIGGFKRNVPTSLRRFLDCILATGHVQYSIASWINSDSAAL